MIYKVTAFTEDVTGGNPAGVVVDADSLSDRQMLSIAQEVGCSETAFVMKSGRADFRVRFFTPVAEVDLCGHATVATFNLLRDLGIINVGEYRQETKAGVLQVKVGERCIYMEQNPPEFFEILHKDEIAGCFKSRFQDYVSDLPIQVVSTGLKDLILPVKNLDTLFDLQPELQKIEELSIKLNVTGIHAFSLETITDCEAHARNFAPRFGIDEESATGTANGALACYLMRYLRGEFDGNFTIEQGFSMQRPSRIKVQLEYDGDEFKEVYVGGSAVAISTKMTKRSSLGS